MKTIQELYSEVMESQELKEQFIEAAKAGKQEAFLKEHGCEATLEEVKAFLEAKQQEDAPLSVDELENAAGGTCNYTTILEGVTSIMTAGTVCGIMAAVSAGIGHVSQEKDDEGRLCTTNAKL